MEKNIYTLNFKKIIMRKILFWLIVLSIILSSTLKNITYANPDYICTKTIDNAPCEYDENKVCWVSNDEFLKEWYTLWWDVWNSGNIKEVTIDWSYWAYNAYISGNYLIGYNWWYNIMGIKSEEITSYNKWWVKWSVNFKTMKEWFLIFDGYITNFKGYWKLWYYKKEYTLASLGSYTYHTYKYYPVIKKDAVTNMITTDCCEPWKNGEKRCIWIQAKEMSYINIRTDCESGYEKKYYWESWWDSWRLWVDYISLSWSCTVKFQDSKTPEWMIKIKYLQPQP